jgi:hypothetical protein
MVTRSATTKKPSRPRSGPVVRVRPGNVSPAAPKAPEATPVTPPVAVEASDPVVDMLNRYGFDYKLEVIDLARVNRAESKRNQARIAHPINEDQVILYAEAMKNGDSFPPLVVYLTESGYIVMDGNHRVAAFDLCDETTAQAYVVKKPSNAQVQAFTYEANTKHGMPTTLHDRIRQAISMVNLGASAVDAAKQLGVPLNTLRSALDNAKAEQRFQELGIKKFDRLSSSARRRLDNIHSNVVLRAAAELALEAGMSSEDITTLAKAINGVRNERDQLAIVAQERQTRSGTIKATAGGRIPVPVPLTTLQRITSTIIGLDSSKVVKHLGEMPDDVRAEYLRAVTKAQAVLLDLTFALARPKR